MRVLTAEASLQCENLNEVIDAEKLAGALKQQSEIDALSAFIRL